MTLLTSGVLAVAAFILGAEPNARLASRRHAAAHTCAKARIIVYYEKSIRAPQLEDVL